MTYEDFVKAIEESDAPEEEKLKAILKRWFELYAKGDE